MTDDLVKRLRDWSEYDEGKINDARDEAADRIQKLEAALRYIERHAGNPNIWYAKIARKALDGKDD